MKSKITIRLLGRFSFHCADQELLLHTSSKAKEILCYLAVNRRGPVPRDRIAAIISSEPSPDRSAKALRHALWQLKADLCPDGQWVDGVIRADGEWIQFVMNDSVSLDIAEFELAAKDPARRAHAVGLYPDEFLHGWDQEWCNQERERLRQIYLETLDSLVTAAESTGDINAGVAYAMLALHNDPTRECTHRALMWLFSASGDRTSALRQYERCVEALRTGIGVEPDDETKILGRRIRAGHGLTEAAAGADSSRLITNDRLSTVPKAAQAFPRGSHVTRK